MVDWETKIDKNIKNRKERKGRQVILPVKNHSDRVTMHKRRMKPARKEGKRTMGDKSLGTYKSSVYDKF